VIEISLHGRGCQGVVAAGELLVKGAVKQGIYAQSIPFLGGERREQQLCQELEYLIHQFILMRA